MGLVLVFFLGFFLAGGRDVLRPETLTRVTGWLSAPAPVEGSDKAAAPAASSPLADAAVRCHRLIFLPEAVNARVPAEHFVPVSRMPNRLTEAIVAVEDSRFYQHPGFDIEAIARAALVNIRSGEIEEGASTITQQLVKNLFLTPDRTFDRKAEELALALDFEARYSKNEILALYLNTIYFGSGFYGIYDAAHGYFGKEPSALSLPEAAMLAGLPNAPSLYSPYEDFLMAKRRQFVVLDAMVRAGYIDERTATEAKIAPIYLVH
ncbi:MAG: transglycosylase domain-containing protein [Schwartzia sp.]|nr:transglycosylase domain-containing protein [Schwartzia sp. (in: firmicutes)]